MKQRGYVSVVLFLLPFAVCAADENQVRIRLEAKGSDGQPISVVRLGDAFSINAYVQDLTPSASGVFSTYMDLTYPEQLVEVHDEITYAFPYRNGTQGSASLPGIVDEVGAFGGLSQLDGAEHLLFTLDFTATSLGNAVFASDPAESVIGDVLVYGLNDRVPPELVSYGQLMVSIFPEACDLGTASGPIGDLDQNGTVGFGDFIILSQNYGRAASDSLEGDIDCDGRVAFGDFIVLSQTFGQSAPIAAAVPEPAGVVMLLVGASLIARRRRRALS